MGCDVVLFLNVCLLRHRKTVVTRRQALVKFNESLALNKNLRERIDTLRRERVVFDSIYKKLERELHEKKKVKHVLYSGVPMLRAPCDKPKNVVLSLTWYFILLQKKKPYCYSCSST